MRGIECTCGHVITAKDDDALLVNANRHVADGQCEENAPWRELDDDERREVIARRAYDIA